MASTARRPVEAEVLDPGRGAVVLVAAALVLLQAGNATVTAILTVYVTGTLRADVVWAGTAPGVAAALEEPPWC